MVYDNRRIARNTVFLYGRLLVVLVISLYTVRILLNALGVEDYGVYNVVGGFVSLFSFFNTTMANATQRFYNFEIGRNGEEAVNEVYNAVIRTQIICAIIIILVTEVIGVWYVNTKMIIPADRLWAANGIFQFSVLSLLLMILQIPYSAAAMAYERMDFYAIVGVIDVFLKLVIAFIIQYYAGDKLFLYGILFSTIAMIDFGLYYIYSKKNFRWLKYKKIYSKQLQKELLSFSGWNIFGSSAYMLRQQGINILLNYFFGVIVNAANGIASQVSSALQYFSANLVIAFKPQLIQSYASGNYDRTREMFFMMTKISYVLMYVIAIPIMINVDYVLKLWLGDAIPEYTSDFSILVIIMMLVGTLHTPIVQIIQATGCMRRFQIITSIVICSIIPISLICFIIGCDPKSCYWVCVIIYIINQIVALKMLNDIFEYSYWDYFKLVILKCITFSLVLPIIPIIIKQCIDNPLQVLLLTCIASFFISIPLFFIVILNQSERAVMFSSIKQKYLKDKSKDEKFYSQKPY